MVGRGLSYLNITFVLTLAFIYESFLVFTIMFYLISHFLNTNYRAIMAIHTFVHFTYLQMQDFVNLVHTPG